MNVFPEKDQGIPPAQKIRGVLSFIWLPSFALLGIVAAIFVYSQTPTAPLKNFDKMIVSDGFHKIDLASGQHFDLSYEQNHDRIFEGTVRHTSMDHENSFPILSFDILVTSGDFANSTLVSTQVENHHFSWVSLNSSQPQGTINLLHTVPMNQAVEEQLAKIKDGDHVIVKGWDILKIDGYSKNGEYIGYWEDSGCNTTLVTDVYIK